MCPGRLGKWCCPGSLQCLREASPPSAALGLALWLLVTSPQSPVIAESGVIFFVSNTFKFVLRRSCNHGPFVHSVILVLSCLVFILKRLFESFFCFSCCLWECWGSFLFLLKMYEKYLLPSAPSPLNLKNFIPVHFRSKKKQCKYCMCRDAEGYIDKKGLALALQHFKEAGA